MKKWIVRIGFLALSLTIALAGAISYFTYEKKYTMAEVTKFVQVDGQEEDVKVEVYARTPEDRKGHPVFAISELINKAINYKKLHPEEEVTVDAAIYRFETDTACYYHPDSKKYGRMTTLSGLYKKNCERVAYSFIKAAKYGIKTRLLYHRDKDITASTTYDWFMKYMDESTFVDKNKKVSDFLEVRKAAWSLLSLGTEQMHSKQVLVNHYLDWDGTEYHNAVNSMTSNVDKYVGESNVPIKTKDWTHTGYTISGHNEIFARNEKYFEITFNNYQNRAEFVEDVMTAHANDELNFEDNFFECYFFPIPQVHTDGYDEVYNPYAKYAERMNETTGQIKCYINNYHFSENAFSLKFCNRLRDAYTNNTNKGNDFGCVINLSLVSTDNEYQLLKNLGDFVTSKMTHSKDCMIYLGETQEYITITGSVNIELGEFCAKSNTGIVFKENAENHEIWDCMYRCYKSTCAL